MPKPIYGINGSGMHTHMSLFSNDANVFYDAKAPRQLSEPVPALHRRDPAARERVLRDHQPAGEFVPAARARLRGADQHRAGRKEPQPAAFACPPRAARATRIELRMPDPACNPYLALAVMLRSGSTASRRSVDPGPPINKNIFDDEPPGAAAPAHRRAPGQSRRGARPSSRRTTLMRETARRPPVRTFRRRQARRMVRLHQARVAVGGRSVPGVCTQRALGLGASCYSRRSAATGSNAPRDAPAGCGSCKGPSKERSSEGHHSWRSAAASGGQRDEPARAKHAVSDTTISGVATATQCDRDRDARPGPQEGLQRPTGGQRAAEVPARDPNASCASVRRMNGRRHLRRSRPQRHAHADLDASAARRRAPSTRRALPDASASAVTRQQSEQQTRSSARDHPARRATTSVQRLQAANSSGRVRDRARGALRGRGAASRRRCRTCRERGR